MGGWAGGDAGQPGRMRASGALHPTGGLQRRATRSCAAGYMGRTNYLGEIFFDYCVNMPTAPHACAHRRAGLARGAVMPRGGWLHEVRRWSAGGRAAVCGAPAGRESRFWGVVIIAVRRAFVLGLGARHRGINRVQGVSRGAPCKVSNEPGA